jgi:transcriptional regulator with XRE-family HTH domain
MSVHNNKALNVLWTNNTLQLLQDQIGKKLVELRKQKGYSSHEQFAVNFGLARVQYWRIEKGKANFTIKSLTKILTIHNLTVLQFFTLIDHDLEKIVKEPASSKSRKLRALENFTQ